MALEPAGISLEAQGFNRYIRQLEKINKTTQQAFDVDSSKLDKAFSKAGKSSKDFDTSLQKGIKGGISGFASLGTAATAGLGAVVVAATAAAAAIAAVGVAALNVASDTDQATKQIASQLGITGAQAAEKYSESLQQIFVDNPQAQFAEIADAIALTERALDLDTTGIEQVAGDALGISQVFGQDLQKTVGATEQLIEKFGLTGQQATDLLTFGLQNIPTDDLIDSIGEYSNAFADAGFTANEFFSVLSTGAAGGVLGTDRAADAVKEFQIRFLEGNKSLVDSFGALGLNFDQLTRDVSTGQRTISDVFGLVVDRAAEVDLSTAANRAAIAGLGTQFEDLGAAAIASLDPDAIGLEDVTGAAGKLDERFNNLGDAFESVKRGALVALAPIGQTVIDLATSIVPKIKSAFEAIQPAIEAFAKRVVPAFQFAAQALGRLVKSLGLASSGASAFEAVLNGTATVIEAIAGSIEILARVSETLRQVFAFARAGASAFGSLVSDVFTATIQSAGAVGRALLKLVKLDFAGAVDAARGIEFFDISASLDKASAAAVDTFKEIAIKAEENPVVLPVELGAPGAPGGDDGDTAPPIVPDEAIPNLEDYQAALKQAEQLQLSFARSAEDAAIKLARANEDIARKQSQSVAKLQKDQAKDRDKLLKRQAKELDKFEAGRRKQIAKAEGDIQKARKEAGEQRKRDQQKLQRELAQAQARFNLSQLQSERRFRLQETRLIAEGDILALKELREDEALRRQEEKENFDLSKKEQISSAQEQQKEQSRDLENKLSELKAGLEDQRAELLKSFDEQLIEQQAAQAEAKAEQQRGFEEAAAERAIQLAREEEDRRLSQARQLEDLGRSLAEQAGVTAEGSEMIAGELEKVFGIDGAADSIMKGFTERTENDFAEMYKNLEKQAQDAAEPIQPESLPIPAAGRTPAGIPAFQEGGIVPGPMGSPQIIQAHGGETVLPTHQQSFIMAAPVIPSQSVDVNMSGGFNISGDGQADEAILQAATAEMTENFKIAVRRLARRN